MAWPASNVVPLVRVPEEALRMPLPFRIRLALTRATSHYASRLEDGTHTGSPVLSPDGRLFALGTRTLADLIAPAGAEIRQDHLQLDAQYLR